MPGIKGTPVSHDQLVLGSEHYDYLSLMQWNQSQKLEVYARATQGLSTLEPDPEKQLKYLDFIDIYTALDDNEMEKGWHEGVEGMLRKLN